MTRLFFLSAVLLYAIAPCSMACTMYKVTQDGKTIVGNNEDWLSPNTQIWFANKGTGTYSVMYVGFMDMAQGAMNEAGLIMDGFATSWLPVKNIEGKTKIDLDEVIETVMHTMSTVEEVKAYYEQFDLSAMGSYQLVYIDRSGTYLIIEGDEMIIGEEPEKTFSNFYYSQTESIHEIQLPYYQKGLQYIEATETESTLNYCGAVMQQMAQTDITATQYSTIYDLTAMKVRVYYHHDFTEYIEFDLTKEFKKKDYKVMMADLFPESSSGKQFYLKYNDPENPYWIVSDAIGTAEYTEEELTNAGIAFVILMLGNEWHNVMENSEAAVEVFKYGIDLMPNNTKLFDNLGEVYFDMGKYEDAKISFERSLQIDPTNAHAKDFIERINKI